MGINITAKTDYTALFSSLGSSSSSSGMTNLNFLSDYASIKNGSYSKLMKAYYAKDSDKTNSSTTTTNKTDDTAKELATVEAATDSLKESADTLLSSKLYAKDDEGNYSTDAIYSALSDYVSDYNNVLNASDNVTDSSILSRTLSMVKNTANNTDLLSSIGITIKSDSSLSLDKATFAKADMGTVKALFSSSGSYGYQVSAQASLINFSAQNAAGKNSIYSSSGSFTAPSAGNILDSLI